MTLLTSLGTADLLFVAYFTKGLGDVVVAELTGLLPEGAIEKQDDRFLLFRCAAAELEQAQHRIRTVDDLRILTVGPTRVTNGHEFAALCSEASRNVHELLAHDPARAGQPWSVTVSARNPVWRDPPEWDPAPIIAEHLEGADMHAKARSPVDLRLQVDGAECHASVNIWERPLGKRDEDAPTRPGALRPTVAAALVRLTINGVPREIARRGIYDPFAGTGTILAEAFRLGLPVFGTDIDEEAVRLTRERLARLAAPSRHNGPLTESELLHRVFRHDVRRGLPDRVTARIVVGNLPWGKQVKVESIGDVLDATAELVARIVSRGGMCALLTTNQDLLVSRIRKRTRNARTTIRRIGLLGQTPAIVTATSG